MTDQTKELTPDEEIAAVLDDVRAGCAVGNIEFIAVLTIRTDGDIERRIAGRATPASIVGLLDVVKFGFLLSEFARREDDRDKISESRTTALTRTAQ